MKKVLAILLAVLMMAAFVPAFAIGAASAEEEEVKVPTLEEAIDGLQKLVAFQGTATTPEGYADVATGVQFWSFSCGFLDGNVYFDKPMAKTLLSKYSDNAYKKDVVVYVDGKYVGPMPEAHSGYRAGEGVGGAYQLAIISGAFTKDVESKVTIVFGQSGYYTEFTVTPNGTNLGVDKAEASIRGAVATFTVESAAVAAKYKVGDTAKVRLHDDHDERTVTVKSITGNTVVFVSDDFKGTSKTIVEFEADTDNAFTVFLNENRPGGVVPAPAEGQSFYAAIQTRAGAVSGTDMRFILSTKVATLNEVDDTAKVSLTFKKGDAVVKTFTKDFADLTYMYEVQVNGEYWTTEKDTALFGFIINGVPAFAWSSYELTVTDGEETLYSGVNGKDIQEVVAMGGYTWLEGEQNIHAGNPENPTSGDRPGNNEGAWRLFDKTDVKIGVGSGEGNNGTVIVTWDYASAKTVSLYALYTGNDSTGGAQNRNPLGWTLYGSTDGTNYVEIDKVENATFTNEGGIGHFFTVDTPTAYQYYKIQFTTNSGAYFQLAELKLYETATSVAYNFNDIIPNTLVVDKTSNPNAHYGHESVEQLFDGDANTKYGYYAGTNNVTFTWSYATPQKATGYGITTAGDSTRFNRNPNGWTLYGSTDGTNWIELDKVQTSTLFTQEIVMFGIDTPAEYQYYKMEFAVSNHQFQMAEITLYN